MIERTTHRFEIRSVIVPLLIGLLFLALPGGPSARAEAANGPTVPGTPSPEAADLRALSELLDKPAVRAWLRAQGDPSAHPAAMPGDTQDPPHNPMRMMGRGLDAARARVYALAAGVPDLPAQLVVVRATLVAELSARGALAVLGPLLAFGLLGVLAEQLFWRATAGLRRQMIALPVDTIEQRLVAIGWRTLYGVGVVAAFAAGSVGAFLALDWPPLLQEIVLTCLLVFLAVRLALVAGRIVLAPGAERFRMLPMATGAARYWLVWSAVLVGTFCFAKGAFRLVPVLGATVTAQTLVGIASGFAVLVLSLVALARRPASDGHPRRGQGPATWVVGTWLVGVWLTGLTGETAPFNVGLILLLLALANLGLRQAVHHLLASPDGAPDARMRPVAVVAFERGLRILLALCAALVIAYVVGLDLTALAANDTVATRAGRGALNVLIIALAADLVWGVAGAWMAQRLSVAGAPDATETDEQQRRRQRLRTLLPVLRNVLLIVLLAAVGLMALATLGVEIGPLIAGAGVVGIAVGFGAQTLVKDVISGLFFLFDDAFRVGEYIESGPIKGTVEAFSLRSIKVRHHRGQLHTVPFGTLSAITNYSRDWVIDKMTLGLDYDTDLDRVKRIVKQIGRALKDDPEFAPHILEPLKMQGVDAFGDFAIQVRLKMMTRPGEQFTIRRRAYALIKQAFDAEGIRFAYPTVSVASGNANPAAAAAFAQMGLDQAAAKPARDAAKSP